MPHSTKMKINCFPVLMALILFGATSCHDDKETEIHWEDSSTLSQENKELKAVWDEFKFAIKKNDLQLLKKLSADCIYCHECTTNSPAEIAKMEKILKADPDANIDYLDQQDVPINRFIKEDVNYVFNADAKAFFFNDSNIEWISEREDVGFMSNSNCYNAKKITSPIKLIEVSVGDKHCHGEECSQTIFSFVQTKEGYKFCGFINIP